MPGLPRRIPCVGAVRHSEPDSAHGSPTAAPARSAKRLSGHGIAAVRTSQTRVDGLAAVGSPERERVDAVLGPSEQVMSDLRARGTESGPSAADPEDVRTRNWRQRSNCSGAGPTRPCARCRSPHPGRSDQYLAAFAENQLLVPTACSRSASGAGCCGSPALGRGQAACRPQTGAAARGRAPRSAPRPGDRRSRSRLTTATTITKVHTGHVK